MLSNRRNASTARKEAADEHGVLEIDNMVIVDIGDQCGQSGEESGSSVNCHFCCMITAGSFALGCA